MTENSEVEQTTITPAKAAFYPDMALRPFYAVLVIVGLIIAIKVYAYFTSGSAAMLASLIDSIGDAALSFMAYLSLRLSLKPADEEHRFGHGKAEGFSALIQASFLFGATFFLQFETGQRFYATNEIQNHEIAISVSLLSILLTLFLVRIQKSALKSSPSLALEADEKHYASDIYLNGAVITALLADLWGGYAWLDLVTGVGIALYIAFIGKGVMRSAVDMLMDREISPEERELIIRTVLNHKDVLGMHDLRSRKSGMSIYISFDVELDPQLTLKAAHEITRELDHALLALFPNAEIIVHKDPKGDTYDARHKVEGVHH